MKILRKMEILRADRSQCNESKGKKMAGCLAIGDVVVAYFPTESALRNASLISAAPELLSALEILLKHEGETELNSIGLELKTHALEEAICKAKSAIAKAKGEA
jgi:hypothetical protein